MTTSKTIAFNRDYVDIAGSITAALMLSQAVYWTRKTENGWFYKSQAEWQEETGLKRREQDNARKRLRVYQWWQEDRHGPRGTVRFRVDVDALQTANQNVRNVQPESPIRVYESANLNESECTKRTIQNVRNVQPPYTETTTENKPYRGHTRTHAHTREAGDTEKKPYDDDKKLKEMWKLWNEVIPGTRSITLDDKVYSLVDETSVESVKYGIQQALEYNKRSYRYVATCARNHAIGDAHRSPNGHNTPTQTTADISWEEISA